MRYGSVCSGIEAATRAWEPLGWSPEFFSEIDKFPSAVLAHHYGSNMPGEEITGNGIPNYGDMTDFERWPDHAIDILVGGTPCQDYSVAGLRAGMAGDRGSLTLTYIKLAARYRPRWVVWENVPGVLSSNSGKDFARFLGDLSGTKIEVPENGWKNSGVGKGIGNAYGLAYVVRDTQYCRVGGFGRAIPQRRRRVFVVGYLGDWRRAAAVLLEPESLRRDFKPCRKAGEVAPTIPARRTGGGGLGTDFDCDGGLIPGTSHTLRGEGFDASEDGTGRGTPIIPAAANPLTARMAKGINTTCDEGQTPLPIAFNAREDPEVTGDRSGPLGASHPQAQAVAHPIVMAERGREGGQSLETRQDGTSNTILTPSGGRGGLGVGAIAHEAAPHWAVRRLTPVECERLQGFPDGFTQIPWRKKSVDNCPDGPRYKALGNSMSVNVMRWIGTRIQMVEEMT